MFEKVLESENLKLKKAWKQVKANHGAPGIDGMMIGDFPRFIREHWETIRTKLREGSYQPSPVKRIHIPKPDGLQRPPGIPTVLDRVIQQAIAQVLTPIYEQTFCDSSHGFRPGRSAHGAVAEWHRESLVKKPGKEPYVVDCDLKSFFDTVDHHKLMSRLRERIGDARLLALIGKYLKAGLILPDGKFEDTRIGMPRGGPLSPLLANILLDELDHELEARGHRFVRYADDFVILCRSPRAGQRILESISRYLKKRIKLIVNETKSKVVGLSKASFLGFTIVKRRVRWTEKSEERFKAKVRLITRRTRGVSPGKVIGDLRLYIRGAINYYMPGLLFQEARDLDQWMSRWFRVTS